MFNILSHIRNVNLWKRFLSKYFSACQEVMVGLAALTGTYAVGRAGAALLTGLSAGRISMVRGQKPRGAARSQIAEIRTKSCVSVCLRWSSNSLEKFMESGIVKGAVSKDGPGKKSKITAAVP